MFTDFVVFWSSKANGLPSESLEDNIRKLESDKESLVLQVSVLSDQVEAQGEKIRDLETSMDKDVRQKSPKKMTQSVSRLESQAVVGWLPRMWP